MPLFRSYYFQIDDDESIRDLFLSGRNIAVNGEKSTIYFKPIEDEHLMILSKMAYILDKLNNLCVFLDIHRDKFKLDETVSMKKVIVIF